MACNELIYFYVFLIIFLVLFNSIDLFLLFCYFLFLIHEFWCSKFFLLMPKWFFFIIILFLLLIQIFNRIKLFISKILINIIFQIYYIFLLLTRFYYFKSRYFVYLIFDFLYYLNNQYILFISIKIMGGGSSSTNKNKKIANPVEQNW